MWYAAFTLGLFGSLHCIGMCGPLAIAFCAPDAKRTSAKLISSIGYHAGKTSTYAILGLLFGLLGSFLFIADLQKTISILLGLALVITFILSIDIDHKINSIPIVRRIYQQLRIAISGIYQQSRRYPSYILGMANGLLPCGLVYLALAGALATGDVLAGMFFMIFFGLGTAPMLIGLVLGMQWVSPRMKSRFRSVLPYVTLSFGMFLIYRGVVVDMPEHLNFWEALKNPIMCH